jgi:hypothetical protein
MKRAASGRWPPASAINPEGEIKMFCPKCATQNLDGASFCRSCGANISLVPQALTGQISLPNEEKILTEEEAACFKPGRRALTLERAFKNLFLGIAFVLISVALSRSIGAGWWFWMLIPAAMLMGTGIAQYIRLKELQSRPVRPSLAPPVRTTEHLMPPAPSVTEGTTRHLTSNTSKHR